MKKKSVFVALLALVLLTGCSKTKKLTCTQKESYGSASMEAKAVITFKDDYATKSETTIVADFEDEETAKAFASYYDEQDKSEYKVKTSGKKVTVVQTEKVDKKDAKKDENKYDEVKKTLTNEGFTCK